MITALVDLSASLTISHQHTSYQSCARVVWLCSLIESSVYLLLVDWLVGHPPPASPVLPAHDIRFARTYEHFIFPSDRPTMSWCCCCCPPVLINQADEWIQQLPGSTQYRIRRTPSVCTESGSTAATALTGQSVDH